MVDHLPQISQTICVSAAMLLLLPSSAAAALGCLCFPNSRNFAVPRKEHPTTTTTTTSRVYSSDWVFPSGFLLFINSLFTMCVQFCFHPRCKERRRGGVMVNRLNSLANQTRRVAASDSGRNLSLLGSNSRLPVVLVLEVKTLAFHSMSGRVRLSFWKFS